MNRAPLRALWGKLLLDQVGNLSGNYLTDRPDIASISCEVSS